MWSNTLFSRSCLEVCLIVPFCLHTLARYMAPTMTTIMKKCQFWSIMDSFPERKTNSPFSTRQPHNISNQWTEWQLPHGFCWYILRCETKPEGKYNKIATQWFRPKQTDCRCEKRPKIIHGGDSHTSSNTEVREFKVLIVFTGLYPCT